MDWETELIVSFETILHRDFPNPQRIGCPGRDSLMGLAAGCEDAQSPNSPRSYPAVRPWLR